MSNTADASKIYRPTASAPNRFSKLSADPRPPIIGSPTPTLEFLSTAELVAARHTGRIAPMDEIPDEMIREAADIVLGFAKDLTNSDAMIDAVARALLAQDRAATERAAKIAERFSSRDARNLKEPERWETWTDDDGNPIVEVKRGATYTMDFRRGIASAIRSQP